MLRVGGYAAKPYRYGWVVGKPQTNWSEAEQRDVDNLTDRGYYPRLRHALTALLDRSLRESAVGSVTELLNELKATERRILDAVKELEAPHD